MPVQVLIVDDDGAFRRLAARGLAERGYRIAGEAETVAQARAAIDELRPDAILLDVNLPDGDGGALADELAVSHPGLRVLLTSSDAGAAPPRTGFLAKPDLLAANLACYLG